MLNLLERYCSLRIFWTLEFDLDYIVNVTCRPLGFYCKIRPLSHNIKAACHWILSAKTLQGQSLAFNHPDCLCVWFVVVG